MSWMQALVIVHVLSALVGIGPTFFGHVLLRRGQTVAEYRTSMGFTATLEKFPKIGGTIAVLSGIGLAATGDYGSFMQFWMFGSLVLYVLIQISMVAMVVPTFKKLHGWLSDPLNKHMADFPPEQRGWIEKASNWMYVNSALGLALFLLMIAKPLL